MMRLEWWVVPNSLDYPHGLEVTPFRIVPTDWGPEISLRFNQSIKKNQASNSYHQMPYHPVISYRKQPRDYHYEPRSVKEMHRRLERKKATRIQKLSKGPIIKGGPMIPCKDSRPPAPQVLPAGLRLISLQRVLNHIINQGSSQSLWYLLWG